jgi:hypothetical protein
LEKKASEVKSLREFPPNIQSLTERQEVCSKRWIIHTEKLSLNTPYPNTLTLGSFIESGYKIRRSVCAQIAPKTTLRECVFILGYRFFCVLEVVLVTFGASATRCWLKCQSITLQLSNAQSPAILTYLVPTWWGLRKPIPWNRPASPSRNQKPENIHRGPIQYHWWVWLKNIYSRADDFLGQTVN